MAYDGFYSGLSTRQSVSELLTIAGQVRDDINQAVADFDIKLGQGAQYVEEGKAVLDQTKAQALLAQTSATNAQVSANASEQSKISAQAHAQSALTAASQVSMDKSAVAADRATVNADKVAVAADRAAVEAIKNASSASATEAKGYRDEALASKNAAANSQADANNSKIAAKASQDAAAASQSSAATSASNAQSSATAATNSATLSAAHATNSQNSAVNSQNSAVASAAARDVALAARDAALNGATNASNAGLQLGMSAWGYRPNILKGFVPDDGQEYDRSLFPDFAKLIDDGGVPNVTEAQWQGNPTLRGCFVANSSPGKFRMRDLNGVSLGSIGAAFQRGGALTINQMYRDQMQSHKHRTTQALPAASAGELWAVDGYTVGSSVSSLGAGNTPGSTPRALTGVPFATDTVYGDGARTGTETFPTHAIGCWMTRVFGAAAPLGSAETNSLVTAYAALLPRVDNSEKNLQEMNRWRSPALPVGPAQNFLVTHGRGRRADDVKWLAILKVATAGYGVGTVLHLGDMKAEVNYAIGATTYNHTSTGFAVQCTNGANATIVNTYPTGASSYLPWAAADFFIELSFSSLS
ncbi:tail fiber protein [Pseudomonas phage BroderSalsa]|nr:tail fiber protein [Pseudomonas phage BroderSalsa]